MGTQQRYCWNCGKDLGLVENRFFGERLTCGDRDCDRAAADADREEREEAHRDLDERMGW